MTMEVMELMASPTDSLAVIPESEEMRELDIFRLSHTKRTFTAGEDREGRIDYGFTGSQTSPFREGPNLNDPTNGTI